MSTLDLSPAPGAAPLTRQVRAQASMEVRLLLRNAYFVQAALIAPVVFVVLRVQAGRGGLALGVDGAVVGVWTVTAAAVGRRDAETWPRPGRTPPTATT